MNLNEKNILFNEKQMNFMKGTIHDNDNFEWDDPYIFDILKSELPKLKLSGYEIDNDIYEKYIKLLLQLIDDFNNKNISAYEYKKRENIILKEITKILDDKEINKSNIYIGRYYNKNAVDIILKFSKGIFINGDGGIGKSYLLYKFVEELKKNHDKYIISFGKFNKKFEDIDIRNIIDISKKQQIYFIIDAFNEYDEIGRNKIVKFISKNIKNNNIKFIVSYRNNSLKCSELNKITKSFNEIYEMYGIDMDRALSNLINNYGVDVTKYEDIINLQNPLYIKLLKKCLDDKKITQELVNSESQITFIYEQFIKRIDLKIWKYTKDIVSRYMFDNEIKQIEESTLKKLLNDDFAYYVDSLQQNGLLNHFFNNGKKYYYFTIDTMNDFIIARSFFNDITNLTDDEIIELINNKLKKLYSLYNAFILCLFDKFSNNITRALKIIEGSKLRFYFDASVLRMIKFEKDKINLFQKIVNLDLGKAFNNLVGYPNKPYNFCNFFNSYFLEKDPYLKLFYNDKNYYVNNQHFKQKAKVVASLIKKENYDCELDNNDSFEEYFWFSFWFMGTCNENLRDLSKKNVYEMCNKCNKLFDKLVEIYPKLCDEYIKIGIVEIICSSSKKIVQKYTDFLKKIYYDENELNSLKIVYIDNSVFDAKRKYITIKKKNLVNTISKGKITSEIENVLFKVEIYDKYLLPWRYWSKDKIDCNLDFITDDKNKLTKINEFLTNKYPCLMNDAIYCKMDEDYLLKQNDFIVNNDKIDDKIYLRLFQTIIYEVAKKYEFNLNNGLDVVRPDFFNDTLAHKIIILSRYIFEGTLMCNYYIDKFCLHKNTYEDKVGFAIYNPYEYDDSLDLNYSHPYSLFNTLIDELDEKSEESIFQIEKKEDDWEDDVADIKKNLFNLIKPITIKGEKWVLLSACLRYIFYGENKNKFQWMDTYLINSTYNSNRQLTGIDDRYITIEQNEYNNSILDYVNYDIDECSIMKPIKYNSHDFPENSIVLPPANLIKILGLHYRTVDSSWINDENDIVIISNNNSKKNYKDTVTNSVYIKEKYYNEVKKLINYFSFTSRSKGEGYSQKSEFHMNFNSIDGEISCINNSDQKSNNSVRCTKCTYNKIQTEADLKKIQNDWDKLLKSILE